MDQVLLVEDDAPVREALAQTLELDGLQPIPAGAFVVAKDHLTPDFPGVVLSDIRMPGRDGFHLLDYAQAKDKDLPVILLTGEGDVPMAVKAISEGAFDFLEKPCAPKQLLAVVHRALKLRKLVLENRALKAEVEEGDAASRMIVGRSPQSETMRRQLRQIAQISADVLITGAPGTGMPKLAEVIHLLSPAARRPFEKRAAAGLSSEGLLEALEAARDGTLFLDEVAQLSPDCQLILQDRMDSTDGTRVVAGTYRDLEAEAQVGRFSLDLAMKLTAVCLRVPPLRERPEDIPFLFRHYVQIACEQAAIPEPEITPSHIAHLMAQDWPGNSRGLMNAAMRFALGLSEDVVQEHESLAEQMARVERSLLSDALQRSEGQASEAAKRLKVPRKTFYDKLARHGLRPEDFRSAGGPQSTT